MNKEEILEKLAKVIERRSKGVNQFDAGVVLGCTYAENLVKKLDCFVDEERSEK